MVWEREEGREVKTAAKHEVVARGGRFTAWNPGKIKYL